MVVEVISNFSTVYFIMCRLFIWFPLSTLKFIIIFTSQVNKKSFGNKIKYVHCLRGYPAPPLSGHFARSCAYPATFFPKSFSPIPPTHWGFIRPPAGLSGHLCFKFILVNGFIRPFSYLYFRALCEGNKYYLVSFLFLSLNFVRGTFCVSLFLILIYLYYTFTIYYYYLYISVSLFLIQGKNDIQISTFAFFYF